MECRGLRSDEMEEMIALQCLIFQSNGQKRYHDYVRGDSSYQLDQSRVAVENGRLLSTLRIWDRQLRIGSCSVRTAGVGGVGSHPDYRGRGSATALLRDAVAYLGSAGYHVGMLFSEIPTGFYGRTGWAGLPRKFFRLEISTAGMLPKSADKWCVEPFKEARDLEQVVQLYHSHNAVRSGSLVRPRAYWDMAPSRLRGVLPTVVARNGKRLGGYLNYQIGGDKAQILDVGWQKDETAALSVLAEHLLQVCLRRGVSRISGEMPHDHPLVVWLSQHSKGDLHLSGNTAMMLYAVDLVGLLEQLCSDLQDRLRDVGSPLMPLALRFVVNGQKCVLRCSETGNVEVVPDAIEAITLDLPETFFWRLLFGESTWLQLAPALSVLGVAVSDPVAAVLSALFPEQEVLFWGADHF